MSDLRKSGDEEKQTYGAAPANPMDDQFIGFELAGRYKITKLIGTGGWGSVYLAQHLGLGTSVAIKIIHKHLSREDASLRRLEQEAKLLNKMESPNIVRIMDYAIEPFPYIVMEYFDGIPLNDWLKQNGHMEYHLALELVMQICDGISNASDLGLVHRDLKPSNILLKLEGERLRAKILDFGIAKMMDDSSGGPNLTATGEVLGSPPYMSPEQWSGKTDHRSDIYSLGCIMYELLSGKPAFNAQYGIDYLNKHISEYPPQFQQVAPELKLPGVLDDIVRKCIQKKPANRYQTSAALKADLELVKAGRTVRILLPKERKPFSPRMVALAASAVLLLGAAAWCGSEQLLIAQCQSLNLDADKAIASGKVENAIDDYRKIVVLAPFLPRQYKGKLHAMRMLSQLLHQRNEYAEASSLDNEVNLLIGRLKPDLISMLQKIAYYKDAVSDYKSAEQLARKSLAVATSLAGENSMAYSWALDGLACCLRRQGDLKQALDLHLRSLKIAEELREPIDEVLADRLNNIGLVYYEMGKTDEAMNSFQRSLAMFSKLGMQIGVSTVCNNIGCVFLKEGKYEQALEWFGRSQKTDENNKGNGDVSTVNNWTLDACRNSLSNMAEAYVRLNQPEKAIACFKKVLDLRTKQGSQLNLDAESDWTSLGKTYYELKDFKNAEACFEHSLKICQLLPAAAERKAVVLQLIEQTRKH